MHPPLSRSFKSTSAKTRLSLPAVSNHSFALRATTIIALTGLPSPDYFPFTSISANILPADAFALTSPPPTSSPASTSSSPFRWLWRIFGGGHKDDTTTRIEVPHEPRPDDGGINLSTALQYGPATGLTRTKEFIREFTERVYAPVYDGWTTLVHAGNTDGYAVHIVVTFRG